MENARDKSELDSAIERKRGEEREREGERRI